MWFIIILFGLVSLQESQLNLDKKGLAIEGYDPVSYFSGDPTEGVKAFSASHRGATYYFSTRENQQAFQSNPEKYCPQYGGWCAYAMGLSPEKVKINPETYKIIEGKLYLFYDFWGTNTLKPWNENEEKLMQSADQNWQKISKQ